MKIDEMHVERELHIAAPEGMAAYSTSPSYTATSGMTLLEAIRYEGLHFDAQGRKVYYAPHIFRRRSEDNGHTWVADPDWHQEVAEHLDGEQKWPPCHILDPNHNLLIAMYAVYEIDASEEMFARSNRRHRTGRSRYQISGDGGRTWSTPRWIVDSRPGYDEINWAPGIAYGQNGGHIEFQQGVFLPDNSFCLALSLSNVAVPPGQELPRGQMGTVVARVHWASDLTCLQFRFGDTVLVGPDQAAGGCCEPALVGLGGERLFMVMRCQGNQERGIHSTRYSVRSEDAGMTWSSPEPLRYDDGSTVWTPASLSAFFCSTKTGKTYWLANILPGPVYAQTPRYPLSMAEFDPKRCCILKDTVQVIQDLPAGAPKERRYTNWGMYEEQATET